MTINELSTIGGADIIITGSSAYTNVTSESGLLRANMFDDVLYNYSDSIKSFGYMGEHLGNARKGNSQTMLSD